MDTETCNKGVVGWIARFPIFVFLNQIVINKTQQGRVTYPAAEQQSGAGGLAGEQGEGHGERRSVIFLTLTGKLSCPAILTTWKFQWNTTTTFLQASGREDFCPGLTEPKLNINVNVRERQRVGKGLPQLVKQVC